MELHLLATIYPIYFLFLNHAFDRPLDLFTVGFHHTAGDSVSVGLTTWRLLHFWLLGFDGGFGLPFATCIIGFATSLFPPADFTV
jgi:hypothetical protein